MISTSGSQLLPSEAVKAVLTELLPITTLVTPNMPEAVLLLRSSGVDVKEPENIEDATRLAVELHRLGPKNVLLKGGHLPLDSNRQRPKDLKDAVSVVDILYDGSSTILVESAFSHSKNTHGTGCSLASAIAANIANGLEIDRAVRSACRYVEAGIKSNFDLGKGHGPINHFHSMYTLPFAP